MFALVAERFDGRGGCCFSWVRPRPWTWRSGAGDAHAGARGWSRTASGAARGRPRAALSLGARRFEFCLIGGEGTACPTCSCCPLVRFPHKAASKMLRATAMSAW